MQIHHSRNSGRRAQRGAAMIIMMLIIVLGLVGLFTYRLDRKGAEQKADRQTALALAQAKEALIGFAASVDLSGPGRPGDLPCPDENDDGTARSSCGNASGSTGQGFRLGRLPWKTLGLPDLRDGNGERLWYAVSTNFKNNTRSLVLNSDTPGTITVRDPTGAISLDGTTSGAIAIIFSPGAALTRTDGYIQNRICVPCNALGSCTGVPPSITPKCNPINYLDLALGEDNKDFIDSTADGFIRGPIRNGAGIVVLNDRLITITADDLMPVLEKRVGREILGCLTEYATNNLERYPWAAPLNPSAPPEYADLSGQRFGRIPDTPFVNTPSDAGASAPMSDHWGALCKLPGAWWGNWKELVFYGVADANKPSTSAASACGICLTVNPPTPTANKKVAVLVAGRKLPGLPGGQSRITASDKGTISNYLENQNASFADDIFEQSRTTTTFNDTVFFSP